MLQQLRRWLHAPHQSDPIEQGESVAFQIILLLLAALGTVFSTILVVGILVGQAQIAEVGIFLLLAASIGIISGSALWMVRHTAFQAAVITAAVGITSLHSLGVIASQLASPDLLLMYLLPITLAGLLSSRRALPVSVVIACAATWIAAFSAPPNSVVSLPSLNGNNPPTFIALNFTIITLITATFFGVFGNVLNDALHRALYREQELQTLRNGLEETVAHRTADLQAALREVETRAAEENRLRHEADEQREFARRIAVPVIPVSSTTLIVPLVGELDTQRIEQLQHETLEAVAHSGRRRVILDITGVPVIDTQVAQGLIMTTQAIQLLGGKAVLVGIRPEVAQAMVSLGITLHELPTFADLQSALSAPAALHFERKETRGFALNTH